MSRQALDVVDRDSSSVGPSRRRPRWPGRRCSARCRSGTDRAARRPSPPSPGPWRPWADTRSVDTEVSHRTGRRRRSKKKKKFKKKNEVGKKKKKKTRKTKRRQLYIVGQKTRVHAAPGRALAHTARRPGKQRQGEACRRRPQGRGGRRRARPRRDMVCRKVARDGEGKAGRKDGRHGSREAHGDGRGGGEG